MKRFLLSTLAILFTLSVASLAFAGTGWAGNKPFQPKGDNEQSHGTAYANPEEPPVVPPDDPNKPPKKPNEPQKPPKKPNEPQKPPKKPNEPQKPPKKPDEPQNPPKKPPYNPDGNG